MDYKKLKKEIKKNGEITEQFKYLVLLDFIERQRKEEIENEHNPFEIRSGFFSLNEYFHGN